MSATEQILSPPTGGHIHTPIDPVLDLGQGDRLLGGPPNGVRETLENHLERLGTAPSWVSEALIAEIAASGLVGRGGSGFPVAVKLSAVAGAGKGALVVVNASESEPASNKDRTLVRTRPHLVLDGAALAARAVGARTVVIRIHRGELSVVASLQSALAERAEAGLDDPVFEVSLGGASFLAGESTALVSALEGGDGLPKFGRRSAINGVGGRPTLVQNAETVAHIALIGRHGASWFRMAGTDEAPGSFLVTLAGDVREPGKVVEIVAPVTFGELIGSVGGVGPPPVGVLIGGYGGTWLAGLAAWDQYHFPGGHTAGMADFGCGLVGVAGQGRCGLAEAARLMDYLARESTGQCGPCVRGLPALAAGMARIADGRARKGELERLASQASATYQRGACAHPDGAVRMMESALESFSTDLQNHLAGRPCAASDAGGALPLGKAIHDHTR